MVSVVDAAVAEVDDGVVAEVNDGVVVEVGGVLLDLGEGRGAGAARDAGDG